MMFKWIVCDRLQYLKSFNCVQKKRRAQAHFKMLSIKFLQIIFNIYMYKQDLALNNL